MMEITFETILNAIRKSIVVLLIVAVIAGALAYWAGRRYSAVQTSI